MGVSFRQACHALASVCIVGTGLLVATICVAAVPRDGLKGEWLLDSNTTNGTGYFFDTSGYNQTGTTNPVNPLTIDRAGNASGAVRFPGAYGNNMLVTYPGPYFANTWPLTISVWFKAEDNSQAFFLLKNANYGFQWNGSTSRLGFYNGNYHYSTKTSWNIGQWYHVVMTDNGSNAVKLYINGSLDKNEAPNPNRFEGYPLEIGSYRWSQWFKGSIDDVRAYSGVLSDAQIGDLYAEEPTPTNATQYATLYSNTNQVLTNSGKTYDATDASSYTATSNAKQIAVAATEKKNTNNAADPITLPKGEFTYENTLMRLPGKNLPFEFTLNYKNQAYYNGPTGINWDHNYDLSLNTETSGNVLYSNGKLGVYRFIKSGSTFGYNAGLRANLTQSGSTYTITYDSGDKYTFSGSTRITKMEDRNGNSLAFAYSWGLLSQVTDTLGRNITYTYYNHNRLKDVTEPGGRKVTLNYFTGATSTGSLYDLQSVTINNGTGATKTIRFEYSTGGTNGTNHNITRLYDALGQTYVTNTYDTGSRVASQTYGSGTLTYAYTLSGSAITKTTVTDKLGHKTEYTYDANGNQIEAKYYNEAQTGSVVYTYTYSTGGYLTKETKPRGNGWTYTYDGSGNVLTKRMKADVTASDSANDLLTTYTYNARGQMLTQTNPIGLQVINTYDGSGNLTTKTASGITSYSGAVSSATGTYTYLSGGLVSTATDAEGRLTTFEYSSGQVSKIIRGTGANTASGTFAYDAYGNVTAATDGDGWTKTMDYTAFSQIGTGTTAEGNVTTYTYDANGNKTSESRVLAGGIVAHSYFYYDILDHLTGSLVDTGSGGTLATAYTYTANGNVASKKIGSGALTQYAYNEFGKVKEERVILDAWDPTKDRVTAYVYDTNGNLTQKTDPMGNVYTYTYDLYDQLTQTTDPSGSYATLSYNKDGTVANQALYSSGNVIQAKTAYAYDGQGNVTQTTKYKNPSASTDPVTTKTAYDRSGKAIQTIDERGKTTSNTYDALGRLATTTDALGNVVTYAYNKRDLVSAKTLTPTSGTGTITTSYAYNHDGRPTTETDNLTHTKTTAYNALGYVTSQTDENGKTTDYQTNLLGKVLLKTQYLTGNTVTTQYAYDERGNLTQVTDGENHVTSYAYNGANEVVQITYPDSSTLNYTYNKNGRVTSQTDPNGTSVSNTYDASNRLSARAITAGSGVVGVTSETYAYDALWHLTYANDSQSYALGFTYDNLGRLNTETNSGQTVAYDYDNAGNLTSVTHPNTKTQTYNYDDLNRPTSVSYDANSVASYVYNGIVNPSVTQGNSIVVGKSFDGLARMASLNNGVKSYAYTYDNVGNILDDAYKTYDYDNLYRLIASESGAVNENWTYDKVGNRTADASNSYTGNTLNQYLSVSGSLNKTYSYDANGNVLSDGVKDFRYDYKNRLVDVYASGSLVAHYEYDVLGRRVLKTIGSGTVRFTYSGENAIEEANITASGTLKKSYLNGLGTDNVLAYDVDEQTLDGSGNVVSVDTNRYFLQKDHLGSVIALTNSGGTIVASYEYDSFGKPYLIWDSHGNIRLFTGREYDEETGLYYVRARYYDPETGRFISRDPIGQQDNINLYTYVGNNPVMFVDLMGLEKNILKQSVKHFNRVGSAMEGYHEFYDYNPVDWLTRPIALMWTTQYAPLSNTSIWDTSLMKNVLLEEETRKGSNIKMNENFTKYADNATNCGKSGSEGCHFVMTDPESGSQYTAYLADIGNMALFYNGGKAWFSKEYLQEVAMTLTIRAANRSWQGEEVARANEAEDAGFYEAGYALAQNTTTSEITQEEFQAALLNSVKQIPWRLIQP